MTLSPTYSLASIDWSSQYGLESPALEVVECEWHYELIVVQARNDDDDDDDDDDSVTLLGLAINLRGHRFNSWLFLCSDFWQVVSTGY